MLPSIARFRQITLSVLLLLALAACGGGNDSRENSAYQPDLSDLTVYQADSPYAPVLVNCATAGKNSCTFRTLPLLAMKGPEPTIDSVMARVAVSHPWMGQRFREVLERLPAEMLTLLGGVTAIVIDDDIRPSFYSTWTGAIYLDPANLWMTNEEKATVGQGSDFRSDYGRDLKFVSLWRYVRGNAYAYRSYSLTGTETRTVDDVLFRVAALLYHELAHANDYFPPDRIATLGPGEQVRDAADRLEGERISDRLERDLPLTSALWKRLAAILFLGLSTNEEERLYTAEFVGSEFARDRANDDYAYSSAAEDVAMLFEETMMLYRFGVDRDIAYTTLPAGSAPGCDDYVVKWGNRNRLGDPAVSARARQITAQLLPGSDLGAFFLGMNPPLAMNPDAGWCSNLELTGAAPAGVRPLSVPELDWRMIEDLLPPHAR